MSEMRVAVLQIHMTSCIGGGALVFEVGYHPRKKKNSRN